MWFTKAKRAQTNEDNETWIEGGVVPTLNAFDNGDSRATVLIIVGTRVDDVRIYEDGIVPTVIQRWGTGGGNVPMIAFSHTAGLDIQASEKIFPTIKAGHDTMPSIAYSIREDAKANNFSATETDTALTLQGHQPSPQSHHAQIFIVEQEPVAFDTYNQTLNQNTTQALRSAASDVDHIGAVVMPAVYEPKSAFEENWAESQVKNALRAGASKSSHAVTNQATVRRLTPTECERLQGFPDGWTGERFDEKKQAVIAQADSNRYKQMGNAVAVPVVDWLIKRLVANQ